LHDFPCLEGQLPGVIDSGSWQQGPVLLVIGLSITGKAAPSLPRTTKELISSGESPQGVLGYAGKSALSGNSSVIESFFLYKKIEAPERLKILKSLL
jgi:hypothetical protein